MKKKDFVSALQKKGYYKRQAGEVIDDIFEVITEALMRGERVVIRNFGSFEIATHKGSTGTDPKTHEPITYPDYNKVIFRSSLGLREAVKAAGREQKEEEIVNNT